MQHLAETPEIGRFVDGHGTVRSWPEGVHVIYYTVGPDGVVILAVRDQRRAEPEF
ncbi:MAG: type II toxin-antitoxin system RelE/ParE family toxin [Shimia sp.]